MHYKVKYHYFYVLLNFLIVNEMNGLDAKHYDHTCLLLDIIGLANQIVITVFEVLFCGVFVSFVSSVRLYSFAWTFLTNDRTPSYVMLVCLQFKAIHDKY